MMGNFKAPLKFISSPLAEYQCPSNWLRFNVSGRVIDFYGCYSFSSVITEPEPGCTARAETRQRCMYENKIVEGLEIHFGTTAPNERNKRLSLARKISRTIVAEWRGLGGEHRNGPNV